MGDLSYVPVGRLAQRRYLGIRKTAGYQLYDAQTFFAVKRLALDHVKANRRGLEEVRIETVALMARSSPPSIVSGVFTALGANAVTA